MSKLGKGEANKLIGILQQHAPIDSGTLKDSIQFSQMLPNGFIVVVGKPGEYPSGRDPSKYAQFVNRGYETHPNSTKLKSDYKFIERSCNIYGRDLEKRIKVEITNISEESEEIDDESI